MLISKIPGRCVGCDFEATRVADEFVQDADDLFELGPVVSLFLPAVQHQLVEGSRAVHRWREAVALIYSLYYLHEGRTKQDWTPASCSASKQHLICSSALK